MALKFLNKKGWHTGSLRNIETVWKAEQKHEGEQKKLEELRKQIQEEREKSEFRLMQEQAGLVPKQERLEFLYDSGLQVGKVAQADEYLLGKPVEEAVQPESEVGQVAAKPGALFVEEKPASANDSWRKLHSDPLFLIRQQEQAAITKIKSNPVKMAEIKKAAEMQKKLKEEKKKKRKEAKRERRDKKKRKKLRSSSSEDASDSDTPRKNRNHGHESDADGDAGHKDRRTQVLSRNLSRSPSRSPTRSPVRKDRRQSPRKLRCDDFDSRNVFRGQISQQEQKTSDLRSKGSDEREFEKRKRVPSRSPSRSPVRRDHDRGRSRRDGLDSKGAFKREGRQEEHNGSDVRSKEFENRDSEKGKRAPSRSPSRSPVRRDRGRSMPRRGDARSLSRSPSRSPALRDHGRSMPRSGDARGASQGEGSKREYTNSDQMLKGSVDRDYDKGKRVLPRSPLKSPSRSHIRRSPVRRTSASRSPLRKSPVRRDRDQQLKGSEDRGYDKRKRVPSRSPSISPSRSLVWRGPVRRSPVRRDHDQSRSRRDDFDSRGAFKGGGRQREQKGSDQRLKEPEDRDYGKRKRAPPRSLSRSLSRSPVRRRDYGQSRSRMDDLDSRGAFKSEGRHREHSFSDQRLKESDHQDSRPHDTREQERRPKSSNNGSADDLRSNDPVLREKKLDAEDEVAERKDTNGVPSRPMNRGRPPKPGNLSDAERAARLAEMQANADVHEEQRWQRLKRAADADAVEVKRSEKDKSNEEFLADTQKSIFASERASASTIEKSVKRRAHFIERSIGDNEKNAFRR